MGRNALAPPEEISRPLRDGAGDLDSRRSPAAAAVLIALAAVNLGAEVVRGVGGGHDTVRAGLSIGFALFLGTFGAAFLQQPGTTARRWLWCVAMAILALWLLCLVGVFVVTHI